MIDLDGFRGQVAVLVRLPDVAHLRRAYPADASLFPSGRS